MSDWVSTRLGDVTTQVQEIVKIERDESYALLGVRWYAEGPFLRETVTSETSKATRFFRVSAGQFIYNRLFAWKGSFGLVGADLAGSFVSNEFPLFECDNERLLPEFLNLHFRQPFVWADIERVSTGTTASRNRWKEGQFNEYQVVLPPVDEQRRVVDVMAAVDAQIEALAAEIKRADMTARSAAEDAVSALPRVPVGDHLLKVEGGRSPMTAGTTPGPREQGVLKVSAVTPHQFVATEAKTLYPGTVMPDGARVRPGDVLITRANTPDRVGAVCRVPTGVRHGLFLCDKTLRLVPKASLDPDFLVVAMGLVTSRKHLTGTATGTSASMFNVSQSKIRSTPIPLPDLERQRTVARDISTIRSALSDMQAELARLRAFRSTLLSSLLSQDVEIPKSYDDLLATDLEGAS